jgi:NAD(P)-dependent dehydrogenase (short-subunit alcohol dehydrogenase family)
VQTAVEAFGGLDVVVNNAGILRDRMLVNMSDEEWDSVIAVHLRGTFAPVPRRCPVLAEQSKAGKEVDARIINTSSPSGLYGNVGRRTTGRPRPGIASFSVIAALELGRYGVTVNAIAPVALTRMTENLGMGARAADRPADAFDDTAPENISPLVVWLGSAESRGITGRVFNVAGGRISVAEGWAAGPGADKGERWEPAELGSVIPDLVAEAAPNAGMGGQRPARA